MKKMYAILGMFLLAGCAQDMGHYVNLPTQGHCKMVTIAPNRNNIDNIIYTKLVAWAQKELPRLGYTIVDTVTDETPPVCDEVILHYSSQFIPTPGTHETPAAPSDAKICVNTPATIPLTRYQLTLEIQKLRTQKTFFSIATEMESTETDQEKILSDMENALYNKFLQVQGPESQVETKITRKILPA